MQKTKKKKKKKSLQKGVCRLRSDEALWQPASGAQNGLKRQSKQTAKQSAKREGAREGERGNTFHFSHSKHSDVISQETERERESENRNCWTRNTLCGHTHNYNDSLTRVRYSRVLTKRRRVFHSAPSRGERASCLLPAGQIRTSWRRRSWSWSSSSRWEERKEEAATACRNEGRQSDIQAGRWAVGPSGWGHC